MLRVAEAKAGAILTQLHAAGLLDKTETGFTPHNWNGRQYKSDVSTDRVKRFRNAKRNVLCNVSETPPDTDTDTERKETRARRADGWPDDYREKFWAKYPNKVGKPKAFAKLDLARKRGIQWDEIMVGLERYIAAKPPDRPWLNPETFLNQERWADQPAGSAASLGASSPEINIEDVVKFYATSGIWSRFAGPAPGLQGCRAPPELLARYGIASDGRRLETQH